MKKISFYTVIISLVVITTSILPAFAVDRGDKEDKDYRVDYEIEDLTNDSKSDLLYREKSEAEKNSKEIEVIKDEELFFSKEDLYLNRYTNVLPSGDENCVEGSKPDLMLDSVELTGVKASEDQNSLDYIFNIKGSNASAPIDEPSVWLLVYDKKFFVNNNIKKGNDKIDKYSEFFNKGNDALYTVQVHNGKDTLSLGCDEGFNTFEEQGITVTVDKSVDVKDLIFVIDGFNVIDEPNEGSDQDTFSLMSNNVKEYRIGQPYGTFDMTDLDFSNYPEVTYNVSLDGSNLESEADLKDLGYNYFISNVAIADSSFIEAEDTLTNDNEAVEFVHGYALNPSGFSVNSTKTLNTIGDVSMNTNFNMYLDKHSAVFLTLYSPLEDKHIPLYGYVVLEEQDPNSDAFCPVDNPFCLPDNYLEISAVDPKFLEIDPQDTSSTEVPVATFSICNNGDTIASVDAISFGEYTKPKQDWGSEMTLYFGANGESIWEPMSETYSNYYKASTHDMKISNPILIDPDNCKEVTIGVSDVDKLFFTNFSIKNMDSNFPVYFRDIDNFYHLLHDDGGNSWWNVAIPTPYELFGTTAIFEKDEGFIMDWNQNGLIYDNPIETNTDYYDPTLGKMQFRTLANQTATIDSLEFTIESTFPEEMQSIPGYVQKSTVIPWNLKYNGLVKQEDVTIPEITSLPLNGTFTVPVDQSLGFNERFYVKILIDTPIEYEGEVIIKLTGVNTDVPSENQYQNLYIYGDLRLNRDLEDNLTFPLINKCAFVHPIPILGDDLGLAVYASNLDYGWLDWFSIADLSDSVLWHFTIGGVFPDDVQTINIDPIKLHVTGNFTDPLELKLERSEQGDSTEIINVLPGDTIIIEDLVPLDPSDDQSYFSIYLNKYSSEDMIFVKIDMDPITASANTGEEVPVSHYDYFGDTETSIPFVETLPFRIYLMGKEKLYQISNFNSAIPQFLTINSIQDEEITMNESCFEAQGDILITKFVYTHDAHDEQPFENVMLSYWNTTIYLPLESWTLTKATFTPIDPIYVGHGSSFCLDMKVQAPTQQLYNTFFDLTEIEAFVMDDSTLPVSSYLQNGGALSSQTPVKGTVTSFL